MRLQKLMAEAGIASRRKCEEIILEGRVTVNGSVVTKMGTTVSPDDKVAVDGRTLKTPKKVYILLNKPAGYICSSTEEDDRPLVTSLIGNAEGMRLFTVGRLDYNTEGAIILTNDGDFSLKVSHPRYNIEKRYEAAVLGQLGPEDIKRLSKGMMIDGKRVSGMKIMRTQNLDKKTFVELVIHEGRNRQVKKMFETVGHMVLRLKRTRIGFLNIRDLRVGQYRHLTPEEIKKFLAEKK